MSGVATCCSLDLTEGGHPDLQLADVARGAIWSSRLGLSRGVRRPVLHSSSSTLRRKPWGGMRWAKLILKLMDLVSDEDVDGYLTRRIVQSSAREWLGSPGAVSLAAAIDLESREAVKSHDSPDLQVHCHCGGAG